MGQQTARVSHPESDFDPDVVSSRLASEPVDSFAADRRAASVCQSEPPAMKWAYRLSVFDPSMAERAARMRTDTGKGNDLASAAENGQPKTPGVQ
jgi:hypothetical protein